MEDWWPQIEPVAALLLERMTVSGVESRPDSRGTQARWSEREKFSCKWERKYERPGSGTINGQANRGGLGRGES